MKMTPRNLFSLFFLAVCSQTSASERPNILFIAVDDLRQQTNFYGEEQMITPHMDQFAESSTVFNRAYCSVPVCGASRASLMSGARPTASRFVNYYARKDKDLPSVPSLSYWFKNHGYTTAAYGKIYHWDDDDLEGWTQAPRWPEVDGIGWQGYLTEESRKAVEENRSEKNPDLVVGPATEAADVPDNAYVDGGLAELSVRQLEQFAESDEPFFLAVGFLKPHLPFNAPKKYWDLYDRSQLHLPDNGFRPFGAPDAAMHRFAELRDMYSDTPAEGPISEELALELIHGYYACVSYTDAQIGKVLDALEETGLAENTIVVMWGDHGYHLGEHDLWCKHANFDLTMKAPLMVRVPGMAGGTETSAITEFIDIYPTLVDLAGLPHPVHLDGRSFVEELQAPDHFHKDYAYSRYHNGESIITNSFIYSQWRNADSQVYAEMLYDHRIDPGETRNVVEEIEYAQVVEDMKDKLAEVKATIK
jgi:arylsulfatase A-like enzyme